MNAGVGHPSKGGKACCYWRSDADGIATWDSTSREAKVPPSPACGDGGTLLRPPL
ncbi:MULTISPECIES: hypothetical protein [unclassified Streptomyces]|uniref:hypothetical protein n=1 Tax=unclassified Streptomyces TaxID=2593676 RepID=UPI00131DFABC|nr:hypothetical protein [Streptomyces sp. CB01635]